MRYPFMFLIVTLSGCANPILPDMSALDAAHARDRVRLETEAGAGRPGAYVCKQYTIGIAEIDWVKGSVVEARGEKIRVSIDDPGNFPHELGKTRISKGSLVWDNDTGWVPCVKALAGHS